MIKRKKRKFHLILSLFLVFALMYCVSAERRFKKGNEMENKGRFEEAARYYIKVLEKDPTWEEAPQRLENVGSQAIEILLNQAYAFKSAEAYEDVVVVLNRIDDLRRRSDKVGVMLPVPSDYAGFRKEMIEAAIISLFKQAEHLEQTGDWAEAIKKLERLKRVYPLSPAQNQRADQARARVFIKWAEQDLAGEYFRAAFDHAQKAIDILGPDSTSGANALEIQEAALKAGTRTVAVLPLWSSKRIADEVPRGMMRELYDVLLYEYLSDPVLFIAPADPGRIHREIRRLRLRDSEITRQMAARIGQNLYTDFVVIGSVETYQQEEKILQEKEHKVRLRSDKSLLASYIVQKYTVKLTAEVSYQIIDSIMRRVVDNKTVNTKVSDQFRRGIYDGDYTNLDLSRSERELFNREDLHLAEQELEDRLIDKLAESLVDSIYERIIRLIK
jgi:tetratricopeptide (TPR) repeat protein